MKKLFKTLVSTVMAVTMCISFVGCSAFGGGSSSGDSNSSSSGDSGTSSTQSETTTYTIQYTDDNGIHKITVQSGDLYSINSIPERTGYTFLGLYDSEVGGTQYVNSSGNCVSAFKDKQNLVLYPQYQAKEYTVVLDYGEAAVTGSRQYTVSYGESLPNLPTNLTVSHMVFSGWYTEEDCGGTKVADSYGLIPVVSILDEDNFEITSSTKYIYLYAGFTTQTYTVTLNYGTGMSSETVEVEYGTNVSDIATTTRDSEGNAVLSWGLSYSGSEYIGTVTDDLVLYALEWAPCITFNSNGGDSVTTIVAKAGTAITLPTATRQLYKFMYWADSTGSEADISVMPDTSTTLKAVWQAMIVFDENGGTDVNDISEVSGTAITLPTPEKDGYIFAGWYTSDETQYTSTKMPVSSVELKAGWYESKTKTIVIIDASSSNKYDNTTLTLKDNLTIDLSSFLDENFTGTVELEAYFKMYHSAATLSSTKTVSLYLYSHATASDSYLQYSKTFSTNSSSYAQYNFSTQIDMAGNKIYTAVQCSQNSGWYYFSDYYINVYYPDTTTLYL